MNKPNYKPFSKFVLRTPFFPFDAYRKLTEQNEISQEQLEVFAKDKQIEEAIFLASPTLYFQLQKFFANDLDKKKSEKVKYSLIKYLKRASSRCTPFGLFAGCTVGYIEDKNDILLAPFSSFKRHTRLDMDYLISIAQHISKKLLNEYFLYFPNTSIYKFGDKLRYVEYQYVNGSRRHFIIEVDNSEYLEIVLNRASNGTRIKNMVEDLQKLDISENDALNFINELIQNQLLISELEPTVSGPELENQIISALDGKDMEYEGFSIIRNVKEKLESIDEHGTNDIEDYLEIEKALNHFNVDYKSKYLFQTDLKLVAEKKSISKKIPEQILKGLELLNKISFKQEETNLDKFKNAFYERYEERDVSLLKALDLETGIGYIQPNDHKDINPLIDDIVLPNNNSSTTSNFNWNPTLDILLEKLTLCDEQNNTVITLNDKDFKDFRASWDDLPNTLSVMSEIILEDGNEKIRFVNSGGSSAANLLGRFCHGDEQIHNYVKEIVSKEKELSPNKVLAEIVHLPENRMGNILMRPNLREYEIPYLSKSILPKARQIDLGDLYLSVRSNRIILKSKKLNMEVIPHLTNAHNFRSDALPIYQFLSELQTQNLRPGLFFSFGMLADKRSFLPRVEYDNLILHEAKWRINVPELLKVKRSGKPTIEDIDRFRKKRKIPCFAVLKESDNELLINFKNTTSVEVLLDSVKNKDHFVLSEFFFSKNGIVSSDAGYYTNQIITAYHK